ncbi:hypothetical protein BDV30DRAFT_61394 [Aspergillus minisclerotigenes]|uniref:Uncharacterized protein n=1 Tax=Aspergillus minisclerotigenes TaxID=656917 RepID=A0A5N6IKC2_9EURO|nr:hypothetical protein BDV30DRAFT_61394 [Aspergillus minisclerotigenes]
MVVIIQATTQVVAAGLETSGGARGKTTVVYGTGIIISAAAARVGCRSNDCQMDKPREGKLTIIIVIRIGIIIGTIILGEPGRPKNNNDHNNSNGIKRALLL